MNEIERFVRTEDFDPSVIWSAVEKIDNLPACNKDTYMRSISRAIDIRDMLSTPKWHVTPVFDQEIAIRYCSDVLKRDRICIGRPSNPIIDNLQYSNFNPGTAQRPNSPPIFPKKIIKLSNWLQRHGYTPCVLYKPETWHQVRVDPAIVCEVGEDWRVFAIWGDVIEEAEIRMYCRGDEEFLESPGDGLED